MLARSSGWLSTFKGGLTSKTTLTEFIFVEHFADWVSICWFTFSPIGVGGENFEKRRISAISLGMEGSKGRVCVSNSNDACLFKVCQEADLSFSGNFSSRPLYLSNSNVSVFLRVLLLCISQSAMSLYFSGQSLSPLIWPRLWRLPWKKKHSGHQRCEFTKDRQLLANLLKNCWQKLLYKISPQIGSKWSSAPEQQQNLNDNHSEYSFHSSQRFRLKLILLTLFALAYLSISIRVGNRVPNLFL